jgi:hypothetical protein
LTYKRPTIAMRIAPKIAPLMEEPHVPAAMFVSRNGGLLVVGVGAGGVVVGCCGSLVGGGSSVVMVVTLGRTQTQVVVGHTSVDVYVVVWPVQWTFAGQVVRVVVVVSVMVLVVLV